MILINRKKAFTLIEILVVVAIIALLISIMLPSLAAARENARRGACKANQHQMGIALTMYTNIERYFPGDHMHREPGEQGYSSSVVTWMPRLMRYLNKESKIFSCPDGPPDTPWDGHRPLRVYLATAYPGEQTSVAYAYNAWGVYNFSPYGLGGHVVNDMSLSLTIFSAEGEVGLGQVKQPADMVAITDSGDDDNSSPGQWNELALPVNFPSSLAEQHWPGNRHSKGGNVLFVDSHVESYVQSELVKPVKRVRQRWNNDNRDHCKKWEDLPPDLPCDAQVGDIDY